MFSKISEFFQQLQTRAPTQRHSIELACTVLLTEVMRADNQFSLAEQDKLSELLQQHFSLSAQQVQEVIKQALAHSDESHDLYTYTSLINQQYSVDDKINLVNMLWQLADADGNICAIENHTIQKIASLLHLRHGEYIASKLPPKS